MYPALAGTGAISAGAACCPLIRSSKRARCSRVRRESVVPIFGPVLTVQRRSRLPRSGQLDQGDRTLTRLFCRRFRRVRYRRRGITILGVVECRATYRLPCVRPKILAAPSYNAPGPNTFARTRRPSEITRYPDNAVRQNLRVTLSCLPVGGVRLIVARMLQPPTPRLTCAERGAASQGR
jgi:hypothetical protein